MKKLLALFLVVLISIDSFAAIVSDNDGSAFVTKAEFEALKKDFAAQINNYNLSIDGKIDGAIANYLAGLKLEKEEQIDALLDDKGFYGKKYYIYWSSANNTVSIPSDNHYALQNVSLNGTGWRDSDDTIWGGRWYYNNFHNGNLNQSLDPYNVALITDVAKTGGGTEKQIYYEKVKNIFNMKIFFEFPTSIASIDSNTSITGWSSENLLSLNQADLTQQALVNKLATYFRGYIWRGQAEWWSVWKTAYITIQQVETDTNSITLHPFSTSNERVWDKKENSTPLSWTSEVNIPGEIYPSSTPFTPDWWKSMNGSPTSVRMKIMKTLWFPWQILNDTVQIKSRKIKNLTDIDKNNGTEQQGLLIGNIPDQNGELKLNVKGEATTAGTIFIYVGDNPVSNWESSDFKGKKVNVTAGGSFNLEFDDVVKKQHVWLMFKKSSTTGTGMVKITKLSLLS